MNAPRTCVAATAALLAGIIALPLPAGAARAAGPAGAPLAAATPTNTIQLVSRIPWLDGSNDFHLVVSVQSALPPSGLELSLQLYPKVTGRSAFEQTMSQSPVANVLEAQLIPLSKLRVQGTSGSTSATLTLNLPVTTGDTPPATQTPAAPALTLACDLAPAPCDGVYPIEVALVNRADIPLSSFTTFLVEAQPLSGALPMRVGWVLPLGGAPTLDAAGQPVLSTSDEGAIEDTVRELARYPRIGVTLQTYGETMLAIGAAGGSRSRALVDGLRTLAASPSHELVGTTFAPVDPVQFAHAGIAGELAVQLQSGRDAMRVVLGPHTALPSRPYVLDGPIDQQTLTMLAGQGLDELVLPEPALAPDSWSYTPTEPFTLSADGTDVDAISADPALAAHFSNQGDPVLLAEDLLADLAEIYFELPYAHVLSPSGGFEYQPRSVVVETPAGWRTNESMLRVVLAGLSEAEQDGILLPTTLTGLLAGDPAGADGEPATRTLASKNPPAGAGPSAAAIADARSDVTAFTSLAPASADVTAALQQDILGGEASDITPEASAALLGLPAAQIAAEGTLVSLPQGPVVTLTSSTGQVPITIESRADQPLHVRLVLSAPNNGLRFPGGTTYSLVVSHGSTVQDVQVNSLTSGDFALRLMLVTPRGAVVLGRGNVTIRSTALSGLAIGLSAGAVALLVVWWIRSSRRRRRAAVAAAAVAVGAEPADG